MKNVGTMGQFEALCKGIHPTNIFLDISRPVWIFGAGKFGRDLSSVLRKRGFNVAGFLETEPKQREISGLAVLSWLELNDIQRSMQLAIGIFNRLMPMNELENLAHNAGFKDIVMPWHIYAQFGDDLGWRYYLAPPQLILDALPRIKNVYQNLADETSRTCLLNILTFRLGRNTVYSGYKSDSNQYFNELTLPTLQGKHVTYIDGGAYNGDTYLELASIMKVATAFLFEPDLKNYKQLVNNVRKSSNQIFCLPIGLSNHYDILSFISDGGGGSTISDHGDQHISTVSLDELIHHHDVNFIKFDVEGAEIPAIRGAAGLIERYRPVLAISLYHRPQDIWEIPELISQICMNYRFYIRQHYYNSFDSVLYAVPI